MGVIAKGEITLSTVNDAYTVSLSKPSCIIQASFDGTSMDLDDASTIVSVHRGSKEMSFQCAVIQADCVYTCGTTNQKQWLLKIEDIPQSTVDALRGSVTMRIVTEDGYTTDVTFAFTIVKEASMLDWIMDWEGGKTKVGSTYIMTPKIFIGKKSTNVIENGDGTLTMNTQALTGVYIGPDDRSAGIYGYKNGNEIFHINEDGGMIGGWNIINGGIQSSNGKLSILSGGAIRALDGFGNTAWEILSSGNAYFCGDKVKFFGDGNAFFEGHITSSSGSIGGWELSSHYLYNSNVFIDSTLGFGVLCDPSEFTGQTEPRTTMVQEVIDKGGVAMFYNNSENYGLIGYIAAGGESHKAFSIGSDNYIAGWNFDHQRISNKNITLISVGNHAGLYMSSDPDTDFNNRSSDYLEQWIDDNGGIYMKVKADSTDLAAYDSDGYKLFKIKSGGVSSIAKWNFNHRLLYIGTPAESGFTESGAISIGPTGIRGHQWRLENDGSGALAGGKISWQADGTLTFSEDVTLNWAQITGGTDAVNNAVSNTVGNKLTKIDANGIYTGTISANNITAGTIVGSNIKSKATNPMWELHENGSGALAGGKISWETDGDLNIDAKLSATAILSPFKRVQTNGTMQSIRIENAYNICFDTENGANFTSLPNSPELSGQVIRLTNRFPGANVSYPVNLINSRKECRFYKAEAVTSVSHCRVLQLVCGQVLSLIAVPGGYDSDGNVTFVNWHVISGENVRSFVDEVCQDTIITDSLWQEYMDAINANPIIVV